MTNRIKDIKEIELELKVKLLLKDFEEKYRIYTINKIQEFQSDFITVSFKSEVNPWKNRYLVFSYDNNKKFTTSLLKEQFTDEELKELNLQ